MEKTKSIDFSKLTLRDALDLAVLVEEEAKERYQEFAHQMAIHHNPEAANFFRKMIEIEAMHEGRLGAQRKALFDDEPSAVRREMIFDIEAPEYDEARATMTVRAALEAALRSEKKAFSFFDTAATQVNDATVRNLFLQLRTEELEHASYVEKELAKLPPEAGFTASDFEDEPVAH